MNSFLITILIVSLCIATLLKSLVKNVVTRSHSASPKKKKLPLPPGPSPLLPFIGSVMMFRKSSNLESHLRDLKAKYGPVFAFKFGYRPTVIIASHSLAHRALFQEGTIFADRPESPPNPLSKLFHSNHHTVVSSTYGPTWRLLRRNLASQMLNPSRSKSYSVDRGCVLSILMNRFQSLQEDLLPVKVYDHFRYGMFTLLVRMCFGDTIPEKKLEHMQSLLFRILRKDAIFFKFSYFFPSLVNLILRYHSNDLRKIRKDQEDLFLPLISARINDKRDDKIAYVDTLVDLQLPDEKRKLNEGELVSLCSEFINAGTDTTTTVLQWIMAHLVKDQAVQTKLYNEIVKIVGIAPPINMKEEKKVIEEKEFEQMAYLKAVVLEALRIHPPAELVLPHAVSEDVEIDGYLVPKKAVVNFMAGSMGRDPEVWEDPMEFKPERFLVNNDCDDDKNQSRVEFDLTSSREIKMMPFGAGRRICPGANFAMLHLQYFVANLVWYFEWKQVDGQPVDLTEKREFTIVMKNPLMAHINPRAKRV